MKNQNGLTLIGTIFLVLLIAFIAYGAVYFVRLQTQKEGLENVKTDMLLVEAKVKKISSDYILSKKDEVLVGTKISDLKNELIIQEFLNENSINIDDEEKKYYVLDKQNLNEIGLTQVQLKEGSYYIVEYTESKVYYTQGYEFDGNNYYDIDNIESLKIEN